MEIQDIKIFMAVAKLGGVSSAAKHLGYVQSNVTARIRAIEKELGCPLFNRHWRGMTLNAEGYKFLIYGEKIIKLMDELNDAFHDEDDPTGLLRIGLIETISGVPKILSSFHKKYKKVELSILSGVSKDLIQEVLNGGLDGAFVAGPVEDPHIQEIPVFEEEVVLVCSKIAEEFQNIQSTNELLQQPLLLFKEGCAYRSRISMGLCKWYGTGKDYGVWNLGNHYRYPSFWSWHISPFKKIGRKTRKRGASSIICCSI